MPQALGWGPGAPSEWERQSSCPPGAHTEQCRHKYTNGPALFTERVVAQDGMGRGSTVKEGLCREANATRSRPGPRAGEQFRDHLHTVERAQMDRHRHQWERRWLERRPSGSSGGRPGGGSSSPEQGLLYGSDSWWGGAHPRAQRACT